MKYFKVKNEIFILKNLLFVLFVVFCIQFTELKFGVIKLSEILLLLLTPFIYQKRVNKWLFYLLLLFIFLFIQTLLLNPLKDFYLLQGVSILKTPYLISLGRFLELISCINLAAILYIFLKDKPEKKIKQYIKYIFNISLFITFINVVIYYLHEYNFIQETRIVYWGDRLRGWFGEGGPYGLMLSFTFILTYFFKSSFHIVNRVFLIVVIFFLAKSKAGILLVLLWYLILYHERALKFLRELNILFLVIGGIIISIIFIKLADNYIHDISNVKKEMKERPTDINLVMGRIAGVFIFPEMIVDYPFFGIGLGNYPIMRNNPKYLDFIPKSPKGETDAHGFGGLVQLLVDGGIIVFTLFGVIMYKLFIKLKRTSRKNQQFLLIFLFFFIFGVQIYFLYPWVLLGILIALLEKEKINE